MSGEKSTTEPIRWGEKAPASAPRPRMRTSRPEVSTVPETFAPVSITRLPGALLAAANHAFDLELPCDAQMLREASREASQAADALKLGLSKTKAIHFELEAAAQRHAQGLVLLLLEELARTMAQLANAEDRVTKLRQASDEPPQAG